jgi:hypothetical protein
VPYVFTLQATGGEGNYTWSITGGTLPPGLTFDNQTATIAGTPTTFGNYTFTAQVTDSASMTGSANLTLTVGGVVIVDCTSCVSGTTLPAATVGAAYSASLSATGGAAPYTWCVVETGSNGSTCDNGSGGALPAGLTINSSTGVISGTPTTATTYPTPTFTVQATDSETIPSSGSATLTLTVMGITPSTLPSAQIYVPYSQTLTIAGGTKPYSWCVLNAAGTACDPSQSQLPPGITLAATCSNTSTVTCTMSGTASHSGVYSFAIQVTDGERPAAVAVQQFTLAVGPISNSLLNGNYAIVLNGYESVSGTLSPFIMAAALILDGNRNIISGFLDLNNGSGLPQDQSHHVMPQMVVPGSGGTSGSIYNLTADGTGTMTVMTCAQQPPCNQPVTYQFTIAVTGDACKPLENKSTCGSVIVNGTSPQIYGSGTLLTQNSADFTVPSIFPGNFALQTIGTDQNGNRYAAASALAMNPSTLVDIDCNGVWGLNLCPMDVDDDGSVPTNQGYKGTFGNGTLDPTTGRGNNVTLTFPNDPNGICLGTVGSFSCTYAWYIIDHQQVFLISADPNTIASPHYVTLWELSRQTSSAGGWSRSALTGSSVAEVSAVDSGNADVTVGLLNSQGNGSASFNSDENDGGTLNLQQSSPGTYALDPTSGQKTGRITLSGFTQFGSNQPVLYMIGSNYAFVVGTDAKVTSGIVEGQTGAPFSDSSILNAYAGGSIWPTVSAVTDSATFLFADGNGNLTGTQYTSGSGGPGSTNLALTYVVDSTGRTMVSDGANAYGIAYVVSPTKFVLLPTGDGNGNPQPSPVLNVFVSGPNF